MLRLNTPHVLQTRPIAAFVAIVLAAVFAATGAAGCGQAALGEGPQDFGEAELRLEARSSFGSDNGRVETDDSIGTLFTWTSARLVIDQIEFDLPDDVPCSRIEDEISEPLSCDSSVLQQNELQLDGPIVVDLITGETTPSIDGLSLPSVRFEDIDVEVSPLGSDEILDPSNRLVDRTFSGTADFVYENQKRELHLDVAFDGEAKANEDQRLGLAGGDTLVLQFNASHWLDNIPVNECLSAAALKAQDEVVVVDDQAGGECDDASLQFRQNLEKSFEVVIERDGEQVQ